MNSACEPAGIDCGSPVALILINSHFLPRRQEYSTLKFAIDVLDVVFHREGEVRLAVKCAGNEGNRAAWHKFADENYTAAPGVSRFFSNVEAQIHFFEIAMQRNRKTEQTRIEKQKSDHAEKRLAIFEIDLGSRRNEPFNRAGSTT